MLRVRKKAQIKNIYTSQILYFVNITQNILLFIVLTTNIHQLILFTAKEKRQFYIFEGKHVLFNDVKLVFSFSF